MENSHDEIGDEIINIANQELDAKTKITIRIIRSR